MYPCLSRSPYRESFYNPPATPAASPTPSRVHYFPVSTKNSTSSTSDDGKRSSSPSSKSQYLDPDTSNQTTPAVTHQTPRSPLSISLMNISRRFQRPISSLVMNNPPLGKKKGKPAPPFRKSTSVKQHNYSKNI